VTVTGLAFEDGIHGPVVTSVQFGTARTTDFQVTGRHTLTVVSPPAPSDAKSVNITVTNTVGTSTTSAVDVFTYIPTSPAQPTGVTATVAGSSSASVSWRTPAFDGGSPITGYSINNLRNGNPVGVPTKVGVVNSAIVTGLVPGDAYSFTVTGITAIGTSTSAASNVVTLPASLPFTEALGYWLAGSTGTVYAHGDAPTLGSLTNRLNAPIVGIASTPDGNGYWLVASDGGVFAFGSAAFHGSMGNKNLNKPIVGMAGSPGGGYWLVASDGGIFTFGNATYYGSMGAKPLNQPIVGMAAAPNGDGYWMVASDGGVFSFGSSLFHGSMGSQRLNKPIVGMASTPSGNGYWMVASDGGIFTFGDGQFEGSQGATPGLAPVVAIGS
jgi:ribosomal protein L24E